MLILVGAIALCVGIALKPEKKQEKPEDLALKITAATGQKHWSEIQSIAWLFMERRNFFWEPSSDRLLMDYDGRIVGINVKQPEIGWVMTAEGLLEGQEKEEGLAFAYSAFCNDSFWLNAPGKLFDPGVELSFEASGLMANYTSGGVTPGDAYLWFVNEQGLPDSVRMFVSDESPDTGFVVTWENYADLNGLQIAQTHRMGERDISISGLSINQTPSEWSTMVSDSLWNALEVNQQP